MICEKCQSEMDYYVDSNTCGWKCKKCGWGIATTYIDPLDADEQIYEISVRPHGKCDVRAIKAISMAGGINYVSARNALQKGYVFRNLSARETSEMVRIMKNSGVDYSITPNFPYEL